MSTPLADRSPARSPCAPHILRSIPAPCGEPTRGHAFLFASRRDPLRDNRFRAHPPSPPPPLRSYGGPTAASVQAHAGLLMTRVGAPPSGLAEGVKNSTAAHDLKVATEEKKRLEELLAQLDTEVNTLERQVKEGEADMTNNTEIIKRKQDGLRDILDKITGV